MFGRVIATIYRMVLWLYPRRVRINHGGEMVAAVESEWRQRATHGFRGIVAFFVWLSFDTARGLVSHHAGSDSRRKPASTGQGHAWRFPTRLSVADGEMRRAIRSLARAPIFTATAAVSLAMGIGANTAVFSVVDRVLLRPLPFAESENLIVIVHPVPGYASGEWGLSRAGYFYFRQHARTLEEIGVYRSPAVVLTGDGRPERVGAALITASILSTLRVTTALGRPLSPEDDRPGAQPVVVLSHDLWTRRYGADESIIGRTILVEGLPEEVIGVMPPDFHFPAQTTELWRPMRLDPNAPAVNQHILGAVARLASGATEDDAARDLKSLVARFTEEFPSAYNASFMTNSRFDVVVRAMLDDTVRNVSQALWIVLGTVAVVLLMACANVANLFLVRAEGRRREVAMRTALGATRAHLASHYLTESFVLAALGGVLGVGFAYLGVDLLTAMAPAVLPRMHEIGLDGRALVVASGLSVLSAVFFGMFPLVHRRDTNLTDALKEGTRSATPSRQRQRIRGGLVVSQVAMALILLAVSGLLIRSFLALRAVDLGFDPANVFTFRVSVGRAGYEDRASQHRFFDAVRGRLQAISLVTHVGMVGGLEIVSHAGDNLTEVTDIPEGGVTRELLDLKIVGAGYFEAMGMRLIEGRHMNRADENTTAPGVVITRSMAEQFWPGQSAVGARVRPLWSELPWHSVVGVIEDVRSEGIRPAPKAIVYIPYTTPRIRSMAFAIRTAASPSVILPVVQREVWAVDPNAPIAQAISMEQIVADDMASTAFTMSLLGVAAAMALLLGAIGIYGVISYGVSQRAPEIGIRLALGAKAGQVGRMILSQTMRLALVGIGVGLVAALMLNRVINSVLFGVRSTDPVTLVGVCVLLAGVAAMAGYLPARRASRVDPLEALRAE